MIKLVAALALAASAACCTSPKRAPHNAELRCRDRVYYVVGPVARGAAGEYLFQDNQGHLNIVQGFCDIKILRNPKPALGIIPF